MITHLLHRIKFTILEKRIKRNPYIGKEDSDGTYLYEDNGYSIRYRIIKVSGGPQTIEWASQKRRLSPWELKIKKTRKWFFEFWHYQKWLVLFRPSLIFVLIISVFLFYFGVLETQESKIAGLKIIIASALGINTQDIQYLGDGWIEISGQRKTAVDQVSEPIRYTFNPFRWFFFSEGGFLTRWRGEHYGYVTHPIAYNNRGEVWINKEGTWRHGRIDGRTIEWETPQGTGIRAGEVAGHDISTPEKRLFIPDIERK
jgi:hypothetical protein